MRRTARVALKAKRLARELSDRTRVLEERVASLEALVLSLANRRVAEADRLLRPKRSDHRFERIGSDSDGGYVVTTDLPLPGVVISVGVGSECSADDALAARGCKVWQFDHTVTGTPSKHENVHFRPIGLGTKGDSGDPSTRTLDELIAVTGVTADQRLWLMLDAEGAEWDLLLSEDSDCERFDLMTIEFHRLAWLASTEYGETVERALRRVSATHVPVFWNANNYAPVSNIGGLSVPDVLEVTFVARPLFRSGTNPSPDELSRPNNPLAPIGPEPFSPVPVNPYGPTPRSFVEASEASGELAGER